MNDYYHILEIKHRFSEFHLLRKYMQKMKNALKFNDIEAIIKVRMGFEVLRNENCLESYNRIHRKYVLNQELNFPAIRELEMINLIQSKEVLGKQEAEKIINNKWSFNTLVTHFLLMFLLFDLLQIGFCMSGNLFIILGSCSLLNLCIHAPLSVGIFMILLGIIFLRGNFKSHICGYS